MDKQSRRDRRQQATQEEIKLAAWAYIKENGVSSLSLRGVASAIGLSAPALYRYFPSKNNLVTALILDAYGSLAVAMDTTLLGVMDDSWDDQFRAIGAAYRSWALETPSAFYLIFGDPVPGYETPFEETMPVAGRSLSALIQVIGNAAKSKELVLPLKPLPCPRLQASLSAWSSKILKTDPDILYLAFIIATRVQGLMMVELARQLPPFFNTGEDLYNREIERIILEVRN
jgi:AcrR family transcriptional regulator